MVEKCEKSTISGSNDELKRLKSNDFLKKYFFYLIVSVRVHANTKNCFYKQSSFSL